MMQRISIFILSLFIIVQGFSQEVLRPQMVNADAQEYYKNYRSAKKAGGSDTIEIPFIDDFSDSFVEPKPSLWADKFAYINNRYSLNPVTAGMATLDAYDYNGAPYTTANKSPFIADYLTSLPINLNYPPGSNIFFSFYYQAKGIGDQPGALDSLCLEFFNVDSARWERVWTVPGLVMPEFKNVMIPIDEDKFLRKGFCFRFLNYATLPDGKDYEDEYSNFDHWNIDYVILDENRSLADTVLHDVSFVKPLSSMLKDFEAIPWAHIKEAFFTQIIPTITSSIINNDNITRNVTKYLKIKDLKTSGTYKSPPLANDFVASQKIPWSFDFDYNFDFEQTSPVKFEVSAILETDAFDYKNNDTIRRQQIFDNFYAYDDGSSEYSYGLNGYGTTNGMVAVRFTSYKPDSLRAVDMYFNQIVDSLNLNYFFYLNIWEDNDGIPGKLIYSQIGERPRYSEELNRYVRYDLDSAVYVEGNFYVGWRKTVDKLSNIGFDLNKNNRLNNFYNLGPSWEQSKATGSIMLRPVLSSSPLVQLTSFNPVLADVNLFPNPADQYFHIELNGVSTGFTEITFIDLTGRVIKSVKWYDGDIVSTGDLENGIYLVNIYNPASKLRYNKKIIVRH